MRGASTTSRSPSRRPHAVLLVGDDPRLAEPFRSALSSTGLTFDWVVDGRQKRDEARIRGQATPRDVTQDAILVLDSCDRITFGNRGAERVYCRPKADALGRRLTELFSTPDGESERPVIRQTVREAGEWTGEVRRSVSADRAKPRRVRARSEGRTPFDPDRRHRRDGTPAALALAVQNSDSLCLVVTDVMMPMMDGLQFIRALRQDNASVPVVAIGGLLGKGDEIRDSDLAGVRFLTKPFTTDALSNAVAQALPAPVA